MKANKIISAIAAGILVCTAAIGVHAMERMHFPQETLSVSYDTPALAEYAEQVAVLVNEARAASGLQPVKFSPLLSAAANIRSGELQESFSHTRPDGTSCFTVMDELGISYRSAAENIAYGQRSPEQVMDAWMNSSGHRANILNERMEYLGVGVVERSGIYYWTQLFAVSDDLSDDAYLPGEDTQQPAVTTTNAPVTTSRTTTTTTAVTTTTQAITTTEPLITQPVTTTEAVTTTTEHTTTTSAATSTTLPTTTACPPPTTEQTTTTCLPPITDDCMTVITKPVILFPFFGNCTEIGG